jgi:hypothetical protein
MTPRISERTDWKSSLRLRPVDAVKRVVAPALLEAAVVADG